MTVKLYLAYGANTSFESMRHRCPAARYVCNVTLSHHQLVFRGVADVVPKRGAKVECAMWLLTDECEAALDIFEGFPNLYVKKYITTHLNGRRHRVMLYVMRNPTRRGQYQPGAGYAATLREGYANCGLPQRQIDNAVKRSIDWSVEHPLKGYGSWFTEPVLVGDDAAVDAALQSIEENGK